MRSQRGLGLVELMVGITIGLIVAAAASMVMVNQVTEHRRLMLNTQLQQDLRAAADLVLSDLRRAGFWAAPERMVWAPDESVTANPYQTPGGCAASSSATQLVYAYSNASYGVPGGAPQGADAQGDEYFGLRLSGKVLQFMLGCTNGKANWQPLTDDSVVAIDKLLIKPFVQTVELGAYCSKACPPGDNCPRMEVRRYDITLVAHAANDARVQRQLDISVRQRNDAILGACPA